MSAAALAIGTGLSAYGNITAGEAKKEAYEMEARAKVSQAAQVGMAADREVELTERRFRLNQSAQMVAFGRSGVQATAGSPLMMMEESAAQAFEEIHSIRQAERYRKSTLYSEAGMSRRMGDDAELAGYLSGAGSILTGFAKNPYSYDAPRMGGDDEDFLYTRISKGEKVRGYA